MRHYNYSMFCILFTEEHNTHLKLNEAQGPNNPCVLLNEKNNFNLLDFRTSDKSHLSIVRSAINLQQSISAQSTGQQRLSIKQKRL